MIDFLHHLFLPKSSNNHRAKLLHSQSILLIIIVLLVGKMLLGTTQASYPQVLGIANNISISDLLSQTNKDREANGLAPLSINTELSHAATGKANDMMTRDYWAHFAPDGTTPWSFIKSSGYDYVFAGENLARGFSSANDVVSAWMASPGHRENMLSPNYKDVGFAIKSGNLTGEDTILVVEMFGERNETAIADKIPDNVGASHIVLISPTQSAVVKVPLSEKTTPSPFPIQTVVRRTAYHAVAAVKSEPLVNSKPITRNIPLVILIVFISILILDMIIIERKKIVRTFVHNLDHIIFLSILLLTILILGKGAIL